MSRSADPPATRGLGLAVRRQGAGISSLASESPSAGPLGARLAAVGMRVGSKETASKNLRQSQPYEQGNVSKARRRPHQDRGSGSIRRLLRARHHRQPPGTPPPREPAGADHLPCEGGAAPAGDVSRTAEPALHHHAGGPRLGRPKRSLLAASFATGTATCPRGSTARTKPARSTRRPARSKTSTSRMSRRPSARSR